MASPQIIKILAIEASRTSIESADAIERQANLLYQCGFDIIMVRQLIDVLLDLAAASNCDFVHLVSACLHVIETKGVNDEDHKNSSN